MNTEVVAQVEKSLEMAVLNIEFLNPEQLDSLMQCLANTTKIVEKKLLQNVVAQRKSHGIIADIGAAIARRSSLRTSENDEYHTSRRKIDRNIANLWNSMLEDFLYNQSKTVWRVELPPPTTLFSPTFVVSDCLLQLVATPTYGIYLSSQDGRMCKGKWNIRVYSSSGEKLASDKFQETTFKERVGGEFPIKKPFHGLVVCTLKQFASLEKRRESVELERKADTVFSQEYLEKVSPEEYNIFPTMSPEKVDQEDDDEIGFGTSLGPEQPKYEEQKSLSQDIEDFGAFEESFPETPQGNTDSFAKSILNKLANNKLAANEHKSVDRPFNAMLQSLGVGTANIPGNVPNSESSVVNVGAHSITNDDIQSADNRSTISVMYTSGEHVITKFEEGTFSGMWVEAIVDGYSDELGIWQLGIPEYQRFRCHPKIYARSELICRPTPASRFPDVEEVVVKPRGVSVSMVMPHHRNAESIYNTLPAMEYSDEEEELSVRSPTLTGDTFEKIISLDLHRRLSMLDTQGSMFKTELESSTSYDDKFARKRENILREIVESERVYTKGLIKLHDEFFTPIFDKYLVPITFEKRLVKNSSQIKALHTEKFLPQLEDCFKKGSGVPALFTKFLEQFEIYRDYVSEYDHVMNLVESMRDSREKFRKFLYEREKNKDSFYSYLILPVQRVPRYRLLLESLLKACPDNYSEHGDVSHALEGIKQLCTQINDNKREIERMTQLGQIQSQILGLPESLHSKKKKGKKREYLIDCLFKEVQKGLNFRNKYRRLYLFSDVLIVTNRARFYKAYHPLQSIRVTQTSVSKFSLQFKTRDTEKPEIRTFMQNDNKELLSAFVKQLEQVKRQHVLSYIPSESDDSESEIDEETLKSRE